MKPRLILPVPAFGLAFIMRGFHFEEPRIQRTHKT